MRNRRTLITLGLALALAACSGKSSDSTGPSRVSEQPKGTAAAGQRQSTSLEQNEALAPQIANLRLAQVVNACCGAIRITVDSYDPDADLFGGFIVVETNVGNGIIPITVCLPGCNPNLQHNQVHLIASYRGRGVLISGTFYVMDRAGNRSNILPFSFISESKVGGTRQDGMLTLEEGGF
jgi:hypothetical protein